jgi:hypothetical protein
MPYDVFISYSRGDEAWAEKLEANLVARGFTVYRDQTRLTAGEDWEPALRDAIVEATSLAVLWSAKAAASKWVIREQEAFRQMMHVDAREGRVLTRRMLQICLESSSPEYPPFQTIADIHRTSAYAAGAAAVDPNVWNSVIGKVEQGLRINTNLPVVHQVLLASTRQRMLALADDRRPVQDAVPFGELIQTLNIPKQELILRYGEEAAEWRPFGGQKSILTLLSELREELLSRGAPPFLWKPASEKRWVGLENKRSLRDLLMSEACVIVLDALSLYDDAVRERYDWLLGCLDNPKAAIAVLPPYSSSERQSLRTVLEAAAAKMFEPFYQPDTAQVPIAASCSGLADDQRDMSRVVAAMVRTAFKKEKSAKLRFGSRN